MIEHRVAQYLEEEKIRGLASLFADAANRVDADQFASLWLEDSVWQIGPPIDKTFEGRSEIVQAFKGLLLKQWEFFVQMPNAHVINIEANQATARSYVNEIARAKDGTTNFNLAVYFDELVRDEEKWKFKRRDYRVLYQDSSPIKGIAYQRDVLPPLSSLTE
ncbi:nuclear transport factor 2 family protein [Gymnodinialimonas hymeniacidonis]|uniref:nuclear transport factor 2 family protein n=1 Tax=Gymnodinialimonas hymeniacidonis TaxID=3126508 RepID=UPI0034C67D1C